MNIRYGDLTLHNMEDTRMYVITLLLKVLLQRYEHRNWGRDI